MANLERETRDRLQLERELADARGYIRDAPYPSDVIYAEQRCEDLEKALNALASVFLTAARKLNLREYPEEYSRALALLEHTEYPAPADSEKRS